MKRYFSLGALLVLLLVATGYSTRTQSRNSKQAGHHVTATGVIAGTSATFPKGLLFVSIAEVVQGSGVSTFEVWGSDCIDDSTTITLGNGVSFAEPFPGGIDSLHCQTLGVGAEYTIWMSN